MKLKKVSIEKEYEKNKNIRPEDAKCLMEWVSKQPHLPQITELEAILFLNCYDGSIEQSKSLVDNYYTSRTHCPEFFEDRDPKKLAKDMDVVLYHPLESTNAFFSSMIDCNPDNYNVNEQIKIMWMVFDLWLLQNGTCDNLEFICDSKGTQFGHLAKININSMKKHMYIIQEAIPLKVTRIHFVNMNSITQKILSIMKPFIKKELLDKVIFHTEGTESLLKYFPESSIPEILGGKGPTVKEMHDQMKSMLNDNADYFKLAKLKKVDETKRPGKPKSSGDLFGIEGTFKKLDID